MSAPRIVVCASDGPAARWADTLRQALPEAAVWERPADAAFDPAAPQADLAVVWKPSRALFDEQRGLRAIFNLGAGVDALATLDGLPRHVPLYRLEDAGMAGPMAGYVLAVALRHVYRFDMYLRQQREGRWAPARPRTPADLQVGVLGLGAIGRTIARALVGQGFQVRGYARGVRTLDGVHTFAEGALGDFLHGLHLLVNVLPLTPATTGILNRRNLARLADQAHVVNLGRGAHLVEADLLALLDGGKLAGATLDVFDTEPLPPTHPFWHRHDVAITPHVSGLTRTRPAIEQVAAKIRALQAGEAVGGQVDWERGY